MRFATILAAAALSATALAAHAEAPTPKQVLDMAAANGITDVQEFWSNPQGGWSGAEGFAADGKWHSLVVDADGKVVRTGVDSGEKPKLPITAAADAAVKNGVAKLRGIWRRDADWIVVGWDAGDKEITLFVGGAKGDVKTFGK